MDSSDAKDIVIAGIISIPVIYCTYWGIKHYISNQTERHNEKLRHDTQVQQLETQLKMSEEETRRYHILAQAMKPSQLDEHSD